MNPQRGKSELHFQTDLCCPQNGETPKHKKDTGHQAVGLPGEAGSRGGGGRPYPAIPTGREANTNFNSRIDQAEERISEVEDQLNEIK